MKEFTMIDTFSIPATAIAVAKKTFLANGVSKVGWIPAALLAVLADLSGAFGELFFLILVLWACDFALGFARAFSDKAVDLEWIKIIRSGVKLFVIAIGVVAIRAIEGLIVHSGIDTKEKLTVAMLLAVGLALAFSCLENLTYFWPGLEDFSEKLKGILGKENPDATHHPDRRSGDS